LQNDNQRTSLVRFDIYGTVLNNPVFTVVNGRVKPGFIDERNGIVRVVASNNDSAALHILSSDMKAIASRVENIASGEEIKGVAFDDKISYIIAEQLYAINTAMPENPQFLNEINTMVTDSEHYGWGDRHFFAVSVDADHEGSRQGIRVTMYAEQLSSAPVAEHSFLLPLVGEYWSDMTQSAAEHSRNAVAVSYEAGIIIVPVTYVNSAYMRVDTFFILGYDDEFGFWVRDTVTEHGMRFESHAVLILDGYIYTVWDNTIRSTTTDATTVGIFTVE